MDRKKSLAALVGAASASAWRGSSTSRLIGGALATAAGAVGLAGYLTLTGVQEPYIYGMKYLAIYAQPSHPVHVDGGQGIDFNPIGAIATPLRTAVNGYALVGAKASYGWLRDGDHIFAVLPGDDVPRLGHVAAIEQRNGRWALVDDKGGELLVSAAVEPTAEDGGHFGKSMIFGERKISQAGPWVEPRTDIGEPRKSWAAALTRPNSPRSARSPG